MVGTQQPRVEHVPPAATYAAGDEAIELAAAAGLNLDPWQQYELRMSMGESSDWKCSKCPHRSEYRIACPIHIDAPLIHPWAAFEVGVAVPRQNGKDSLLEARELAGLFLIGERLIIHSAHQFDTSIEHFRRLCELIGEDSQFSRRVKPNGIKRSHGEEGIELKNGQRIRFRTRTKGGGRGFTGDLLVLNEAMILPESTIGALMPTLSAVPNPQIYYTGSAVDQQIHEHGLVFAKVRARGHAGTDPSLAYFEHSAACDDIAKAADVADDVEQWALANPGMGIRISEEHIARERRAMDIRSFAVERLGIGDWPKVDEERRTISITEWRALADATSKVAGPVCFSFDVTPDRSAGAISVAGLRSDGNRHVEVVDARTGTGWIIDRLSQLVGDHETTKMAIVYDKSGPAASLEKGLEELERNGIAVKALDAQEYARACGTLVDSCKQDVLRHLGTSELAGGIRSAVTRPIGDAWAWSRKLSPLDISPLVSTTLALWGLVTEMPTRSVYEDRGVLVV